MKYGFVYLLRKPLSRVSKIGISGSPRKREAHLEKANGLLYPGMVLPMFYPEKFETRLHKRYGKFRLSPNRKKRGDGHTEWFNLVIWQRWECRLLILRKFLLDHAIAALIVFFAYYLIAQMIVQ